MPAPFTNSHALCFRDVARERLLARNAGELRTVLHGVDDLFDVLRCALDSGPSKPNRIDRRSLTISVIDP